MAEPQFSTGTEEDLPRTLRRAKAEQAAQAREASASVASASTAATTHVSPKDFGPEPDAYATPPGTGYAAEDVYDYGDGDDRVTVTRFDVPFFRLMAFFLKAVLAAIPALILLGAILYGAGQLMKIFLPWLVQAEILIRFPNG